MNRLYMLLIKTGYMPISVEITIAANENKKHITRLIIAAIREYIRANPFEPRKFALSVYADLIMCYVDEALHRNLKDNSFFDWQSQKGYECSGRIDLVIDIGDPSGGSGPVFLTELSDDVGQRHKIMTAAELVSTIDMLDCTYEDIVGITLIEQNDTGDVSRIDCHYTGWQPGNIITIKRNDTDETVLSAVGTDH